MSVVNSTSQQGRSQQTSSGFDLRQFMDDVMSRLNVEDVYGASHQFKESGDRYRGACDFHQSKSGTSFVVSKSSLLFYCAGCQRGGSAIDYLYSLKVGRWDKPRGRDFTETLKELAGRAGMSMPERELSPEQIEATRKWESRRDILQAVTEHGQGVLWSSRGDVARQYLIAERGLTEEAIRDLGLGLYLSAAEMRDALKSHGYKKEDTEGLGLVWSMMEGYILFPWLDERGRPLTIYGRYSAKTPPDKKPKTIALPGKGTKGSPLYLDKALKAGHKNLVLVEGVLDAACFQSKGDTRVCAYVGGSCSSLQIETMKRERIESVTLCGDPDDGGENGNDSNIDRITKAGIKVYVAPKLPDGLDPDEFLIQNGMDSWKGHIDNAIHAYTWKARNLIEKIDSSELTDKNKSEILQQARKFSESLIGTGEKEDLKVFFWPEICTALGVSADEFLNQVAANQTIQSGGNGNGNGGDSSGDDDSDGWDDPDENDWNAPVSWNGEIGYLLEELKPKIEQNPETGEMQPVLDSKGKLVKELVIKFTPRCNFDFQVEREFSSEDGGGLILQVLRSSDYPSQQKRVFIKSIDYTESARFVDALKKVLGSGICCNLKKEHLNALIHVRTREYRNNGGKIFRLAERMGCQEDGTFVFENIQFTSKGEIITEEESGWCFNPNLGGEDRIPSPAIAPPDPSALPNLVAAMARFHGPDGILPAMISLGYGAASAHYQEVMRVEKHFPLLNQLGDAGGCKSIAAQNTLSLFGWHDQGVLHSMSTSATYEWLKLTGCIPSTLDDPQKSAELDELLKGLYDGRERVVRGNSQKPHSPLIVTSNHAVGDSRPATLSRMIQLHFFRHTNGDAGAWDEMQSAQRLASGALPDLIRLGYPAGEIRGLANELRQYLPQAHARVGDSLGIVTWYAMAVAKLANFSPEAIKEYVIRHLCKSANDADSGSDSLLDFIDKTAALHSETQVGWWSVRLIDRDSDGKKYLALNLSTVWPLLEKIYDIPYSRKVIESLIDRCGGVVQSVQKFHINKDESLSYFRSLLNPKTDSEGYPIPPKEPEYVARRCVLIPADKVGSHIALWREGPPEPPPTSPPGDPSGGGNGGGGNTPPSQPDPGTAPLMVDSGLQEPCNQRNDVAVSVSALSEHLGYSQLHKKCNQQDAVPEHVSAILDSSVTFLEKEVGKNNFCFSEVANNGFCDQDKSDQEVLNDKKQIDHTPTLQKNVTKPSLEPEILTGSGLRWLHSDCNEHVTNCNQGTKDVTDSVQLTAPLPLVPTVPTVPDVPPVPHVPHIKVVPTELVPIAEEPAATPPELLDSPPVVPAAEQPASSPAAPDITPVVPDPKSSAAPPTTQGKVDDPSVIVIPRLEQGLSDKDKLARLSKRCRILPKLWYTGDRDVPCLLYFYGLDEHFGETTISAIPHGWSSPQRFKVNEIELVVEGLK